MKEPQLYRELSREDSKMLQGLSLAAMICLHLFCRSYHDLFTPLVFISGVPLSFYIGQLGDFCVFGFALLSGYGHYIGGETPHCYGRRLKHFGSLYVSYLLILVVFSSVSIIAGHGDTMPGGPKSILLNLLLLKNSYNGAHWYMLAYLVLVLTSPLTMKAVRQWNPIVPLLFGSVLYAGAYYVRFYVGIPYGIGEKAGAVGMAYFAYIFGAECCRLKVFSRLYEMFCRMPRALRSILSLLLVLGLLWGRTKVVPSLFAAPISGFALMVLFTFWEKPRFVRKVFLFVGRHSTNIWLTHMFFLSVVFPDFVYCAEYPLLIFALMMGICMAVSLLLQPVEKALGKLCRLS